MRASGQLIQRALHADAGLVEHMGILVKASPPVALLCSRGRPPMGFLPASFLVTQMFIQTEFPRLTRGTDFCYHSPNFDSTFFR
jgi:hypothetical protein